MNQGKLEAVKQEMARVNIDILGISQLKWTGMGNLNSDDHHSNDKGRQTLFELRVKVSLKVKVEVSNTAMSNSLQSQGL